MSLLLGTGCTLLGPIPTDSGVHSVESNVPFVVVTVGGSPAATPTIAVAETIPDSTPLPRIDLPTRDPAAAARAAAAGPRLALGEAARRAARPPDNGGQAGTPVPTDRVP